MAAKKRMTKKERERRHRRRFWAGILLVSLAAAFCVLVTLSEQMTRPFLPTWKEIFQKVGLAEAEPLDSELRVHVIDVGNADAILVQNKGASLLIDAGEKDDGERVLAYLREQGVDKLDMVIATHADADHIGGMKTVINGMDIDAFLMATMPEGYTPTTKTYTGMLEALAGKGVKITEAKPGARYPLGDAVLDILGPAAEFEENNNQSVVCKVTFGAKKVPGHGGRGKAGGGRAAEQGPGFVRRRDQGGPPRQRHLHHGQAARRGEAPVRLCHLRGGELLRAPR